MFVRQADRVMLGCADVTALTNMLAHTEGDVGKKGRVRRAKLGWTSRMKGVCTVKKSAYS